MATPKKRILVVDNERAFAELVRLTLEASGDYEVQTENDSAHTVAAAHAFRPDLILLDLIMPGRSGGLVAAQVKGESELKHVPIVFMTAMIARYQQDRGERYIAGQPVLAKPIRAAELFRCVEKQLAQHGAR